MNEFWVSLAEDVRRVLDYRLFGDIEVDHLLGLLGMCVVVVVGERWVRRHFVARVLRRTRLDPPMQYAVGRIVGYVMIAVGLYVSFQMAGINLNSLAILAGAIGVGLGFGLQNIISNFVSGLIILAERPVSVGDRVSVQGVEGQVREINLRSTSIVTNDNITIIVPNADFITNSVTNLSHGDPKIRFRIPFGVAYGSDIPKLRRIMLDVAAAHPKALATPPPQLFFSGFGDSSLDFELAVWSSEMTFSPRQFRSDLYYAIEAALRQHGIEIPFPQRDLHLRSGTFEGKPAAEPSRLKPS